MIAPAVHPALLAALRGADPTSVGRQGLSPRDWEAIVADAERHGLAPWLHRRLAGAPGLAAPPPLAQRLAARAAGEAARNLILASELRAILEACQAQRLRCAPLRGLALAERFHGGPGGRPMGDLDLLVHRQDLEAVAALLERLGFRAMDRRVGFAEAFYYTLKFTKDRHGWIIVEPHWSLAYPPFSERLDMDRVWQRCGRGRVAGVETWVLGGAELLLHLCLHLVHHDGRTRLLWFWEIDRLVRDEADALDWPRLLSLAAEPTLGFFLRQALTTTAALFTTPVPDAVLDRLPGEPPRSVAGRLGRLLAAAPDVDGKESLALLFTLEGLRPKLRYALALLFPSPEFMRAHHGLGRARDLLPAYLHRLGYFSWHALKGVARLLA